MSTARPPGNGVQVYPTNYLLPEFSSVSASPYPLQIAISNQDNCSTPGYLVGTWYRGSTLSFFSPGFEALAQEHAGWPWATARHTEEDDGRSDPQRVVRAVIYLVCFAQQSNSVGWASKHRTLAIPASSILNDSPIPMFAICSLEVYNTHFRWQPRGFRQGPAHCMHMDLIRKLLQKTTAGCTQID